MTAENIIIVAKISAQTFTKHNSQGTSFSKETIPLLSRKWTTQKGNKYTKQAGAELGQARLSLDQTRWAQLS